MFIEEFNACVGDETYKKYLAAKQGEYPRETCKQKESCCNMCFPWKAWFRQEWRKIKKAQGK